MDTTQRMVRMSGRCHTMGWGRTGDFFNEGQLAWQSEQVHGEVNSCWEKHGTIAIDIRWYNYLACKSETLVCQRLCWNFWNATKMIRIVKIRNGSAPSKEAFYSRQTCIEYTSCLVLLHSLYCTVHNLGRHSKHLCSFGVSTCTRWWSSNKKWLSNCFDSVGAERYSAPLYELYPFNRELT